MQQQIEKLKQEKKKLTVEYKSNQAEYKSEIKKINRAIKIFERGIKTLTGNAKPKRQKSGSEIENILRESGALNIKNLVEKLNERGYPMTYSGVSSLLQLYAKAGKKFIKVAPATYALIESNAKPSGKTNESAVNSKMEAAETGDGDGKY